ncbi:MAG: hypothetical protein H8E89_06890 [Candidatus Nitrosopelagicus sp.]|nr:hypothetical protein [Candidatus Nitrosopelagicus sp.]
MKKQEAKTLKERYPHLTERTLNEVVKVNNQFSVFCPEVYDGRKPEAIFEELGVLGEKDKEKAIIDIFQRHFLRQQKQNLIIYIRCNRMIRIL